MHFLHVINIGLSVLIVCNKTGGTIKGDIKSVLVLPEADQFAAEMHLPLFEVG